jgi:hypothetical protein
MQRSTVSIVTALVALFATFSLPAPARAPEVESVVWMTRSWDAFNQERWTEAITWADRVINKYRAPAMGIQRDMVQRLRTTRRQPPVTGSVSQATFKQIMREAGPMTEVACAYLVKGKSLRALKDKEGALKALRAGKEYTMARAWDPGPEAKGKGWNPTGWLWDVSKACRDEIADIEANGVGV